MLIEYSKLVGFPVFSLGDQSRVAELSGFFINEDSGQIEVFIAKTPGLFKSMKFISAKEVQELSKNAMIVSEADSLAEPSEMIRFNKKMKKRPKIIGQKVVTKSGEVIGTVSDFVLESKSLSITRLYVKKFFDQRIIHSSAIIEINQKQITIKDKFEMVGPEIAPIGAEAKLA